MYEYDLLVLIGRFNPFHVEHKRIVDVALAKAKNVAILIGSASSPRTPRNPFTYVERKTMILDSFSIDEQQRILTHKINDNLYNDTAWIKSVQEAISESKNITSSSDDKVGLIGASKDKSSYYLKLFPELKSVNVEIKNPLDATKIRNLYFKDNKNFEMDSILVPHAVSNFLFNVFKDTVEYKNIQDWLLFAEDYKKQWASSPYPVKHLTVDAVVEQSGHILLIKRKANPGKDLWALPGGHLEPDETIQDGVLRELREETKLKVPEPVILGSVVKKDVFDDPNRSTIGRVVTHAYHIKLKDDTVLPKVKGSDDAKKAKWFPLSEVKEEMMFDDHFFIIKKMLGI